MTLISQAAWLTDAQRQEIIDVAGGDFDTTDDNYEDAIEGARAMAELDALGEPGAAQPREAGEVPG